MLERIDRWVGLFLLGLSDHHDAALLIIVLVILFLVFDLSLIFHDWGQADIDLVWPFLFRWFLRGPHFFFFWHLFLWVDDVHFDVMTFLDFVVVEDYDDLFSDLFFNNFGDHFLDPFNFNIHSFLIHFLKGIFDLIIHLLSLVIWNVIVYCHLVNQLLIELSQCVLDAFILSSSQNIDDAHHNIRVARIELPVALGLFCDVIYQVVQFVEFYQIGQFFAKDHRLMHWFNRFVWNIGYLTLISFSHSSLLLLLKQMRGQFAITLDQRFNISWYSQSVDPIR